jgi:glycogen debranching enzyme
VDADFADLFDVKAQRAPSQPERTCAVTEDGLVMTGSCEDVPRRMSVRCSPPPDSVHEGTLTWQLDIPRDARQSICIEIAGGVGDEEIVPRVHCGKPDEQEPARLLANWEAHVPAVSTADWRLSSAMARTAQDIGTLRLSDPDHPDDVIIAAGVPWYMTLFGRDALLTAYMCLMVDPRIAHGVLRTLGRLQGTRVDPRTEEEPGKILHEIRFHDRPSWRLAEGTIYYGTIDATPLFVILLGELRRWGLADESFDELLPAADRALEWITHYGDRDGDGYVEYQRSTEHGLSNLGWKDSWDGIRFADGRFPEGPIALCEVQGYVYAAYVARAHFADEAGDHEGARHWRERAAELKAKFREDFWLPDRGWIAIGLDGDKQPIDSLASNMGHCLWSGIVDADLATPVANALMSPEMFSGWGIRTLASSMGPYNPVSYHLGSVWPHDNALCVAGLVRYGFVKEAHQVIDAMLDVSQHYDGRLPELLSGISRSDLPVPAVYPTSCMPQAWAAASPLLFVRSLLRFDPAIPSGQVWLGPELPDWVDHIEMDGVPLSSGRVTVRADSTGGELLGVPEGVTVHPEARFPEIRST